MRQLIVHGHLQVRVIIDNNGRYLCEKWEAGRIALCYIT